MVALGLLNPLVMLGDDFNAGRSEVLAEAAVVLAGMADHLDGVQHVGLLLGGEPLGSVVEDPIKNLC